MKNTYYPGSSRKNVVMNMLFFEAATALYLLSAAGYLLYIVKPDVKRTAGIALWTAVAGFVVHAVYFAARWAESGRVR